MLTYEAAIDFSFEFCHTTNNIKTYICVSDENFNLSLYRYIEDVYSKEVYNYSIFRKDNRTSYSINFANGSTLTILNSKFINEKLRGVRYDHLFIEDKVKKEIQIQLYSYLFCSSKTPPIYFKFFDENICNSCACKTCSIFYEDKTPNYCRDCMTCRINGGKEVNYCSKYNNDAPPVIRKRRDN